MADTISQYTGGTMVNLSTNHWNLHNFSPCLTPRVNNNTLGSCRQQSGNLLTTSLDNSKIYEIWWDLSYSLFPLSFTKWLKEPPFLSKPSLSPDPKPVWWICWDAVWEFECFVSRPYSGHTSVQLWQFSAEQMNVIDVEVFNFDINTFGSNWIGEISCTDWGLKN